MADRQSIVYFGSGAFGMPTLGALCAGHDVVCVVTQPDKPAGRGGAMSARAVAGASAAAASRADSAWASGLRIIGISVVGEGVAPRW